MSLFVSLKNSNQSKNLETIDGFAAVFTAMLPGELASSAGNYDQYDGIQTANFMYNVVIINADNALNPSGQNAYNLYDNTEKYSHISITKIQNKTLAAAVIERGDYIGIRSWGRRNMGDIPTSPSCAGKVCFEFP
jgi:hypothetical protein